MLCVGPVLLYPVCYLNVVHLHFIVVYVYAWDSVKRNFNSFVWQVHLKKLTNKTDFDFDFDF